MSLSMTGFARQQAQTSNINLICEVRTVNHRYMESHFRLPEDLRLLEPAFRETLKKFVSRGKVDIYMQLNKNEHDKSKLGINAPLVKQLIQAAEKISQDVYQAPPLNAMEILRWPGVIRNEEFDADQLQSAASQLFNLTLEKLLETREREGADLVALISQRLRAVTEKVAVVRKKLPLFQAQIQAKLRAKLDALEVEVNEDRFHQEIVYLAQKSDVAEELDRIDTHVTETKRTLQEEGPIGRRLDFLMQELNREANTLSSKSTSSHNSQIAVDLKVLIEQMREQVQNIE